jgi:hypothetical protein
MAIAYDRYQPDTAAAATTAAALAKLKKPSQVYQGDGQSYKWGLPVGGNGGRADWEHQWDQYDAARQATNAAAVNPQKQAETQVMDATFGQGNAINDDPRITAALNALNPANVQANQYAQMTDATAAQAGAMADMQRQQFASSGIGMNDPAAQARMRQVETARMQGNNAALGQSQQAGQSAAAQQAQLRLSQMGLAQGAYSQGASMLANKQFGQTNQSAGYQSQVPGVTQAGAPGGDVFQAWQPPTKTQTPAKGGQGAVAPGGSSPRQKKPLGVAERNALQAAWKASQATGGNRPSGQTPGSISTPTPAAQGRLQQYSTKTGTWK